MSIFDDILAAAQTLVTPSSYIPRVSQKRSAELDALDSQQSAGPIVSGLGLSSTQGVQASPIELQRAAELAAANRARATEKVAQAQLAEAQVPLQMLQALNAASSKGTQTFVAKGDKMLKGEGLGGSGGGNVSKVKSIPSEAEKTLKLFGLPGEAAVANPEILQQISLLKQLGFMTEGDKRAEQSKQKAQLIEALFKNENLPAEFMLALLQSGLGGSEDALTNYAKKLQEKE